MTTMKAQTVGGRRHLRAGAHRPAHAQGGCPARSWCRCEGGGRGPSELGGHVRWARSHDERPVPGDPWLGRRGSRRGQGLDAGVSEGDEVIAYARKDWIHGGTFAQSSRAGAHAGPQARGAELGAPVGCRLAGLRRVPGVTDWASRRARPC
ncbi:hypothetical protein QJS66_16185 [Kocuria rhizophila]|nr:hypothetical protein QJS66_16185 [Kocuria rhizophila]